MYLYASLIAKVMLLHGCVCLSKFFGLN